VLAKVGYKLPKLADFEVRIPKGGDTNALTECVITWRANGKRTKTRGVHANQVFAAVEATLKIINLDLHQRQDQMIQQVFTRSVAAPRSVTTRGQCAATDGGGCRAEHGVSICRRRTDCHRGHQPVDGDRRCWPLPTDGEHRSDGPGTGGKGWLSIAVPPYGNGYYPGHSYNRPPNYQHGFNNNTIIVNNGGNDYWNRNQGGMNTRSAKSPITAAKPKRNDLDGLNRQAREREQVRQTRQPDERREAASRDAKPGQARQSGYAGARPENQAAREKMVAKSPPAGVAKDLPQRPKTEYKGAKDRPAAAKRPATAQRLAAAAKPASRELAQQRPAGGADRGRDRPETRAAASKPKAAPARGGQTAFGGGGAKAGKADRQASQRGRSSMGGGGGKKPRKPKH
jgi:hypothetical protein